MPLAPLPIIQAKGDKKVYKLMVDTGGADPDFNQLVFPLGHPEPPESLNVLGQQVQLMPSPWGETWLYADHRPMFNDPLVQRVGEGQDFDFILTLPWCCNKTISFTRNGVEVYAGQGPAQNKEISFLRGMPYPFPFITLNSELYLLDTGIPFSTKFKDLKDPNDNLEDYQLCFSPIAGGILKIQTKQDEHGLMWLSGWSKMDQRRQGSPQELAALMRGVNRNIVGCIGSDYLLNHDLTISFSA
jgi:hypothetical protein